MSSCYVALCYSLVLASGRGTVHARPVYTFQLKLQAQRKLHDSRIAGQRGDLSHRAGSDVMSWKSELRAVEHVERFPTELQRPLLTHSKRTLHGEIPDRRTAYVC